jgi:hypothetical protein
MNDSFQIIIMLIKIERTFLTDNQTQPNTTKKEKTKNL